MKWTSEREAKLRLEQEKAPPNSLTQTLINVAASVTSNGIKEGDPPLLTALSLLFEEIASQKSRTGTIRPSSFISTLKQQNGTFGMLNTTFVIFWTPFLKLTFFRPAIDLTSTYTLAD